MARPAFQNRRPGGELPAGQALGQGELEKHAEDERPEQRRPVHRAADRGGDDIARADPAHRHD